MGVVWWGGYYKRWPENSCHWTKADRSAYKLCPDSVAITVSKSEWVAVNLVPVPLPRLQNQHMHAASNPLPWQSLDCCNHYTVCPWRGQDVWLSVHITWWWHTSNYPENIWPSHKSLSSDCSKWTQAARRKWLWRICHSSLYLPCIWWRSIKDDDSPGWNEGPPTEVFRREIAHSVLVPFYYIMTIYVYISLWSFYQIIVR